MTLHSTEVFMANLFKNPDIGGHTHSYGLPHPHPALPHAALSHSMSMGPLGFGLAHNLDVGYPQGMWGKY